MTTGVFDFKSIRRSLERQEQKAEFEEKNPKPGIIPMYGWPYNVNTPLTEMDWSAECGVIFDIKL